MPKRRIAYLILAVSLFLCAANVAAQESQELKDLVGTYRGSWASDKYRESGTLVLIMRLENNELTAKAVFTGSEYLNETDLIIKKLTALGDGTWKMEYKAKKANMQGMGIFSDGAFDGDYKFKKWLWTDRGKWELKKR